MEQEGPVSNDSINARLARGEIVAVGGKMYALCSTCGNIVRINKPLLGSVHLCAPPPPRD